MDKAEKYKYHLRPEYNSDNLLIEFVSGVENDTFLPDLLNALEKINPKSIDTKHIWMNDEILLEIQSDIGNFTLSKDIWNIAFIMTEDNQQSIKRINSILQTDKRFEKIEVDFSKYYK
jgi:hypothetical protein